MYMKEFFLWYTCCHQIWSQFSFTRMVHCTWMFISISCFYGKEEIFSWWFFSQLLFPFLLTICSHWIFTWFFFFFNVFIFFIMFALFIFSLLSFFILFFFFYTHVVPWSAHYPISGMRILLQFYMYIVV